MKLREVHRFESKLPPDDDHPYRTGPWRPNTIEYDADDLDVLEGAIPHDLEGVYLRNTENPLLPALGRYHPFDGDGMLHSLHLAGGKASYRNRFVRTEGLAAEIAAGEPLWPGIMEPPSASKRASGWGARTLMKDASSTDVVVHAGRALTTFYQCGEAYEHDPVTLEDLGRARWGGAFPAWGISAHAKHDPHTDELLWFAYAKESPYLRFGVLDHAGAPVHEVPVALPGPRLPHDMAFTEHFAVLNDLPVFWDPALLAKGVHRAKFFSELPSRFALVPRKGGDVRWFEAAPTYVLHWINAFESGDEVILDGFFQHDPIVRPDPADGAWGPLLKSVDMNAMGCRPHRWRFDLRTGRTREEPLGDACWEFPMIHERFSGRPYRYAYCATGKPGWFLFNGLVRMDLERGTSERFALPEDVYCSESPMAPRVGGTAEDDGYVVTFVSDVKRDTSEAWIFDARSLANGPIARVALPHRISSGTHACWAPASSLKGRAPAARGPAPRT